MVASSPIRASVALAAYLEPLVEGRRVIVFGDASSNLAQHLLDRGARIIHVCDEDATRAAEAAARNASRNLTFAPLAEGGLAIRDGAFDLAVVEDLAQAQDPADLLRRLKRTLSPRGATLIASGNPDVKLRLLAGPAPQPSLDYYALYDLIIREFDYVCMLGQTPFVGYSIAAFSPAGEPVPAIDTGFVPPGSEEPEWFVALASSHRVGVEEFTLIQLPLPWVHGALRPPAEAPFSGGLPSAGRQVRELTAQADSLRQQLGERDAWIGQLEDRAATADSRADQIEGELEQLTARLKSSQAETKTLEQQHAAAQQQLDALRGQLAERQAAAAQEVDALQQQLAEQRATTQQQIDASQRQLAECRDQIAALRQRTEEQDSKLQSLSGVEDQAGRDISELEQQLQAQGLTVRSLEQELHEAGRISRELVHELEDRSGTDAAAVEGLSAKLDALAKLNAAREGDLAAARFHIQELEAELADHAGLGDRITALEQELARAQTRLREQADLLEQLRSGGGPDRVSTS
jgi:predicted  nucleic acid-binding Zn-ribbon protein